MGKQRLETVQYLRPFTLEKYPKLLARFVRDYLQTSEYFVLSFSVLWQLEKSQGFPAFIFIFELYTFQKRILLRVLYSQNYKIFVKTGLQSGNLNRSRFEKPKAFRSLRSR